MTFAAFLAAMVPGIVAQVFLALGIGILTITGIDIVFGEMEALLVTHLGTIGAIGAGLLGLAGVGQAIGYIVGAWTARVTLVSLMNATKFMKLPT